MKNCVYSRRLFCKKMEMFNAAYGWNKLMENRRATPHLQARNQCRTRKTRWKLSVMIFQWRVRSSCADTKNRETKSRKSEQGLHDKAFRNIPGRHSLWKETIWWSLIGTFLNLDQYAKCMPKAKGRFSVVEIQALFILNMGLIIYLGSRNTDWWYFKRFRNHMGNKP